MRTISIVLVAVAGSFLPAAARADVSSAQRALASQVFDDAEKLMATGSFADACPKYAESQRLDPQLGTLLHLGSCYEKLGKTASAWGAFKDALEIATQKHDEREAKIRAKVAELDPKVPRFIVAAPPGAPPSLEIRADGETVAKVLWGTKLPVDPGAHAITASADGKKPWKAELAVVVGETKTVTVPPLENAGAQAPVAAPAAVPAPLAQPGAARQPGTPTAAPSAHGDRTLAYVVGGIGVVGIAAGSVTGLMAMSKKKTADQNCVGSDCTTEGKDAGDSGKSLGNVSTIAFGVGVAGLAVGTVLWLAAGSSKEAATARRWQAGVGPLDSGGMVVSEGRTW